MQAGRDNSREGSSFGVHSRSNGDDGKLQWSSNSWVHKNAGRGGAVKRACITHTGRINSAGCVWPSTWHFRALTATLGIFVSGIVLLQWTELGSNLLRVFQQNLIWKKKGLAFKYLIVAAACNYTRTPCFLHLNLLGKPFWFEGCSLGLFIKNQQKIEFICNFFLFSLNGQMIRSIICCFVISLKENHWFSSKSYISMYFSLCWSSESKENRVSLALIFKHHTFT